MKEDAKPRVATFAKFRAVNIIVCSLKLAGKEMPTVDALKEAVKGLDYLEKTDVQEMWNCCSEGLSTYDDAKIAKAIKKGQVKVKQRMDEMKQREKVAKEKQRLIEEIGKANTEADLYRIISAYYKKYNQ